MKEQEISSAFQFAKRLLRLHASLTGANQEQERRRVPSQIELLKHELIEHLIHFLKEPLLLHMTSPIISYMLARLLYWGTLEIESETSF